MCTPRRLTRLNKRPKHINPQKVAATFSLATEPQFKMLDIFDFIVAQGGNPEKIKESQRRRFAPEEVVDEVIALYQDHRASEDSQVADEKSITDPNCSSV